MMAFIEHAKIVLYTSKTLFITFQHETSVATTFSIASRCKPLFFLLARLYVPEIKMPVQDSLILT